MVKLPFLAVKLLFSRRKLFLLGTFPGIFTFALSSVITYFGWELALQGYALWISVPSMMLVFLLSWLLVGNLSLIPVEDAIADECQRIQWGEVKLPSPRLTPTRVLRECAYSLSLAFAAILLFFLSLLPILGVVSFALAAWMTSYGFLSSLYARKDATVRGRIRLFSQDAGHNFFLGVLINLLLFVPILNVFLLGYAQILATLVFLHRERPRTYRT